MTRGGDTRFKPGQSGNPDGRPKRRRPHGSVFEVILGKTITVMQDGGERELTVGEALQWQTYQAALKSERMAIREVLKMIEKREEALAGKDWTGQLSARFERVYDADNANEAMRILGVGDYLDEPDRAPDHRRFRLHRWATQAALSRPGRRKFDHKQVEEVKRETLGADQLNWPKGRKA